MQNIKYQAHPTAIIDDGAQIGEFTRIWHWTHISSGAAIGSECSFGQNVYVANNVQIGNRVKVQNNVSIYDSVTLEDDVFCGPSMVFTNVINPRSHVSRKNEYQHTLVKQGASIGANATIICGNTIGEYAFIGAGALITKDVPDYALMLGVPAKRVAWMCQCGHRLAPYSQCQSPGFQTKVRDGLDRLSPRRQTCSVCGKCYELDNVTCKLI